MRVKPSAKAFVRLSFLSGAFLGCGRIGCLYGFCSFVIWQSSRNAELALAYLLVGWSCCICARKLQRVLDAVAERSARWLVMVDDEDEPWRANGSRAAGGLLCAMLLTTALPIVSEDLGLGAFAIALGSAVVALGLAARACVAQARIPPRPEWLGHWAVVRLPTSRPRAGGARGALRLIAGGMAHGVVAGIYTGAFVLVVALAAGGLLSLSGAA